MAQKAHQVEIENSHEWVQHYVSECVISKLQNLNGTAVVLHGKHGPEGHVRGRGDPMSDLAERILACRSQIYTRPAAQRLPVAAEEEGGCGVTGFACTIPVGGRHIYEPSIQMQNRGNGKGGGIAAVRPGAGRAGRLARGARRRTTSSRSPCWIPRPTPRSSGSSSCRISTSPSRGAIPTVDDYRDVPLPGGPPAGRAPLLRPRQARRAARVRRGERASQRLSPRDLEDEFVYQNSFRLNDAFYASLGDKRAFVLSHGREPADLQDRRLRRAAVQYYQLPGHRGPTSGSPTSAIRPRAACGIPAARTRSSG